LKGSFGNITVKRGPCLDAIERIIKLLPALQRCPLVRSPTEEFIHTINASLISLVKIEQLDIPDSAFSKCSDFLQRMCLERYKPSQSSTLSSSAFDAGLQVRAIAVAPDTQGKEILSNFNPSRANLEQICVVFPHWHDDVDLDEVAPFMSFLAAYVEEGAPGKDVTRITFENYNRYSDELSSAVRPDSLPFSTSLTKVFWNYVSENPAVVLHQYTIARLSKPTIANGLTWEGWGIIQAGIIECQYVPEIFHPLAKIAPYLEEITVSSEEPAIPVEQLLEVSSLYRSVLALVSTITASECYRRSSEQVPTPTEY
jgi:hypothetical protein